MNTLRRHRILATLLLAAACVSTTAALRRPDRHTNPDRDLFWATKMSWKARAEFVIAGDSRACRGVAPEAMLSAMTERRVVNFAFDSVGFSERYLEAVEGVVVPGTRYAGILLGITPFSLTRVAAEYNEFEFRREWLPYQSFVGLYAESSLGLLRPVRIDGLDQLLPLPRHHDQPPLLRDEYRSDGWMSLPRGQGDMNTHVVRYREAFDNNPVCPDVIRTLLQFVRRCRLRGIQVYAFRPPIARSLYDVEDELSEFHEPVFIERLERAGGVWITVDPTRYATHDGSHLGRIEAERLSRDLADRIHRIELAPTHIELAGVGDGPS